jgi:hypothetical protein
MGRTRDFAALFAANRMSVAFLIGFLILTAVGSSVLAVFVWERRFAAALPEQYDAVRAARLALEARRSSYEVGGNPVRKRPQEAFLCLGEVAVEQRYSCRVEPDGVRLLVLRERITFRKLALSNWLEQEVPLEEGDDVAELAKAVSLFASGVLGASLKVDAEPVKEYIDELLPVSSWEEMLAPERVSKS